MNRVDLSIKNIAQLNKKIQKQNRDLYSFLKDEFPDISVEDRLKYLSTILNDFLEEYEYKSNDKFKADGYIIKRFYPKGVKK